MFNAWCLCLNPEHKGTFIQSMEVDPVGKNRLDFDCLYTPDEKKRMKPTKACSTMYALTNKDAAAVTDLLSGDFG